MVMTPTFLGHSMTPVPSTSLWQFETPLFLVMRVDENTWSLKTVSSTREFRSCVGIEAEVFGLVGECVELLTNRLDLFDTGDDEDELARAIAKRMGIPG